MRTYHDSEAATIPEKPTAYQRDLHDLHPALVKRLVPLPNWVVWKWELNEKRDAWTKVPYQSRNPTKKAASNRKQTWSTHADAVAVVAAGQADGIGFMLFETNICAFDIDNCIDASGNIDPISTAMMARCGATYFERTVGGRGLRCIGLGGTKEVHRKQKIVGSDVSVETYRWCARYITISNMVLDTVNPKMADLGNIDAVITDVVAELDAQDQLGNKPQLIGGTAKPGGKTPPSIATTIPSMRRIPSRSIGISFARQMVGSRRICAPHSRRSKTRQMRSARSHGRSISMQR